jgi:predicted phosphodiesterase
VSDSEFVFEGDWWKDKAQMEAATLAFESNRAIAEAAGVSEWTVRKWREKHKLPPSTAKARGRERQIKTAKIVLDANALDPDWLLAKIKGKDGYSIEELSDLADVSPKRVREVLSELSSQGYRITDEKEGQGVTLSKVAPDKTNLHPGLFSGREQIFGVVSDTHLGSQEEALEELHLAYDMFKKEGITNVLHAGDLVCGRGIFRGQDNEIKVFTVDSQVDHAVENYPLVEGITTHIIAGNHDVEGDAGRVGFDPVAATAARRADFNYLGPYTAWMEAHGGAWIHLLHGKGGMGYSYSYKVQKLVDGYPGGRKPALLIPGHWHVRGNFEARSVEVLFPGCFEWQSIFLQRLGLMPAVGFHIIHCVFGDDGSLVQFTPRWFKFFEGRAVDSNLKV